MYFKVVPVTNGQDEPVEIGVWAYSPKFGNDSALIAVFNHLGAAKELQEILTAAAGIREASTRYHFLVEPRDREDCAVLAIKNVQADK